LLCFFLGIHINHCYCLCTIKNSSHVNIQSHLNGNRADVTPLYAISIGQSYSICYLILNSISLFFHTHSPHLRPESNRKFCFFYPHPLPRMTNTFTTCGHTIRHHQTLNSNMPRILYWRAGRRHLFKVNFYRLINIPVTQILLLGLLLFF